MLLAGAPHLSGYEEGLWGHGSPPPPLVLFEERTKIASE